MEYRCLARRQDFAKSSLCPKKLEMESKTESIGRIVDKVQVGKTRIKVCRALG